MLPPGFHVYRASAENLTLLADTGDFFALIGATLPFLVLEVEVFQRGSTTLTMEVLRLHRGTGSAGGASLTERADRTTSPAADVAAASLPTTDATTDDWEIFRGFNLLQEVVHLPIPELWLPVATNTDFAIAQATGTAHTGVGITVTWAEFTGT